MEPESREVVQRTEGSVVDRADPVVADVQESIQVFQPLPHFVPIM